MQPDYSKLDQPEVLAVLFHPRNDVTPAVANATDVTIPVGDDIALEGRFHLADDDGAVNILFFHGNGEVVADYDAIGPRFTARNINLLAVGYRGYGRSSGSPTATTMLADAHRVLDWVKKWLADAQKTGPLVLMGRSLGSAAALELAATADPALAGLIIESGFALTMPVLEKMGLDPAALGISEEDCFGNQLKIVDFQKPTYILHGQNDQLISLANAETLQAQSTAQAKEFAIVPRADHNTMIEAVGDMYFNEIKRFLGKLGQKRRKPKSGVRG